MNQYKTLSPEKGDKVFCFWDNQLLMTEAGELDYPTYGELIHAMQSEQELFCELIYLFAIEDEQGEEQRYFLAHHIATPVDMEGYVYHRMFDTRTREPKEAIMAASTAFHLYMWYRDNHFCGRCGQPMEHDKKQRMLFCPECKNMVFPKVAPAVIVGVYDGDRILLTKYANREYTRYALIAGFTEIGETPEETVAREVMEEVGLRVKNIQYYASQPWGYDSNLLIGYFAQLDDTHKIHMDEEELAVAEWKERQQVPDEGNELSLTGEMMAFFRDRVQFEAYRQEKTNKRLKK